MSLLTVDYKIIAKTLTNRIKKYLCDVINSDQSGFIKGSNIGNNILLIMDLINYTDAKQIPSAILLLDIEKNLWKCKSQFSIQCFKTFYFWW